MKTPQSASKPQKGGSALSTPTSGKITKNKSTPKSLKNKVLEKNARLSLLKAQDTVEMNGKSPKTPKIGGTPKKGGSPQNAGSPKKGGSPQRAGSLKNADTPKLTSNQNQTPKAGQNSPNQNGTQGKKRKSLEGTPGSTSQASGKKSKKAPEVSPEVKLGLKIEKLLESPKDKNSAESTQGARMSKNQKKKAKRLAKSAGGEGVPKGNQTSPSGSPSPGTLSKKAKKQKQKEAKKLAQSAGEVDAQSKPNTPSPGNPGKKAKKHKKKEAKKLAQSAAKSNDQATTAGTSSPGKPGEKSIKQKEGAQGKKNAPAPVADKKSKLQKKIEAKKLDKQNAQKQPKQNVDPSSQKEKSEKLKIKNQKKREKRKAKRQSGELNESRDNLLKEVKASAGAVGDFPNPTHVENAIKMLIEEEKSFRAQKPDLLNEPAPILVTIEFFYHPPARGIQRIALPNPYLNSNPDVLYIAADMKKSKKDPEESIEYHTEKFKSCGIKSISEILPLRLIHKEHSQFEEKRKLVNRADAILIDCKIAHRVSSHIPRKFLQKKVPIPVRAYLNGDELKKEVATALKKTAVLLKKNSLCTAIRIGHVGMKVKALVENVVAVAAALCDEKFYPGGKPNVRKLHVKLPKSESYPVYESIVSRNQIPQPKAPSKKKKEVVEGEVSTAGVTVAVHPSGEVEITSKDEDGDSDLDETEHDTSPKKKKAISGDDSDDEDEDDSDLDDDALGDDLDPAEVAKFIKANTADDDDDEDEEEDSDDEGGEIEKAEQEFLLELRKQQDALEAAAKASAYDDEDDDELDEEDELGEEEEDDDESDDEDEVDEEEEEGESDDADIPNLVPAKFAQSKKGKGKPGQNGLPTKGKPQMAQKGRLNAAPKGKPNASQKRGSFQKTKDSPKAKRR